MVAVAVDGVLPPLPSELIVIAAAGLPAAAGRPNLWLLAAVAALGAFLGDQLAYTIGRRVPVRRLRIMRSPRAQEAAHRAESALVHRAASVILAARFLPGARVAVNMAAGASPLSRRRFSAIAAVGAVLWASYAVGIGVGAGRLLDQHHPAVGVAAGVGAGLVIGAVVDRALRRLSRRRGPGALAPGATAHH